MLGRHKLLILIPALILIPILLGMTPVNFVHKIGAGCPFSQGKQALTCNPCPFNSITSQGDQLTLNLASNPLVQEPISSLNSRNGESVSIFSDTFPQSVPLRC